MLLNVTQRNPAQIMQLNVKDSTQCKAGNLHSLLQLIQLTEENQFLKYTQNPCYCCIYLEIAQICYLYYISLGFCVYRLLFCVERDEVCLRLGHSLWLRPKALPHTAASSYQINSTFLHSEHPKITQK